MCVKMFATKIIYVLLILFNLCNLYACLKNKRDINAFFDKSIFSFNGFEKIASVPVLFPTDICLLNVTGIQYAAALHTHRNGQRKFTIFRKQNANYELLAEISSPNAINMDCLSYANSGFIALAYNLSEQPLNAIDGSPVYELKDNRLRTVQYFANTHLKAVYLRANDDELLMLQTYNANVNKTQLYCPYYKWTGSTFRKLCQIPCSNARRLEPFHMNYEHYVAVANYADEHGRTTTNSEIYKYSREKRRFMIFQKIRTYGAVDVRHFAVPQEDAVNNKQHFLIFANSLPTNEQSNDVTADSVFYIFDQTQFVPYQSINLYAVKQFLPIENVVTEKFLLLVSTKNQDTKIYNLDNWKFEASNVQFTEGALSRGVTKMRIYQEQQETYLVIANQQMLENETNIFRAIFKQDEHANALRQEIIEWTNAQIERLSVMDIEKFMHDVETKLHILQTNKQRSSGSIPTHIQQSNIAMATTKSLVYPALHLNSNYWKVLSYANQALDALENEFVQHAKRRKRDIFNDFSNKSDLQVNTLVVKNKLNANAINGIDTKAIKFKNITAKKVIVNKILNTPMQQIMLKPNNNSVETLQELNVKDLQLEGKFNGYNWYKDLLNNTLKRAATYQFAKSRATIEHLQAETVLVNNDKVNDRSIDHLVSIQSGSYLIEQDVQFAAPVKAQELLINERLNNINVVNGKLDVLLKHSNVTQVIEGHKNLETINVLEPITLAGRMYGKQLESLAPVKVLSKNLMLNGNFTITGPVSIIKMLSSDDIVLQNTAGQEISAKHILTNGIRMLDSKLENINLDFKSTIIANNSNIRFVNGKDMQNLLKTDTVQLQIIEGHKKFPHNLHIANGYSEVQYLNNIELESLPEKLLLKDTNQTLCAPTYLGSALAISINATQIMLNGIDTKKMLTKSTAQEIKGDLKVGKLSVGKLNTTHLNTNGKLFNARLNDIYSQKSKNAPNRNIFAKNRKFYGNIFVENLKMPAQSYLNGKTVEAIERQLAQLNGNMKYVGNFLFNYTMNITQLSFEGELNGIPASDFGKCWLQHTGDQRFTAPQTLASVTALAGVSLQGKLNEHTMNDFMLNTYWTNRNEFMPIAQFKKDIQIEGILRANLINGLQFPQDVLLRYSAEPQILACNISVENNLIVQKTLLNATFVNGLHVPLLRNYLSGQSRDQTLHLQHAHFQQPSSFETLNEHNMDDLLNKAWLLNEDIRLHNLEIVNAHFTGLLDFQGPLNGINLALLKENYFSLSRPQQIVSSFLFNGSAYFAQQIDINNIQLLEGGTLIERESEKKLYFDEFVQNSLKINEPKIITAQWNFEQLTINGNLWHAEINNLNLTQDVLRLDLPLQEIMLRKQIVKAKIKQIYALPGSYINNIDVSNWLNDAAYIYENHTIKGLTTIETLNINNNLQVHGNVNNMQFNAQNLMLLDMPQVVQGDVHIRNILAVDNNAEEAHILASNIGNLQAKTINSINMLEFLNNQAHLTAYAEINSQLTFTQPVVVEEYEIFDETAIKLKREIALFDCSKQQNNLQKLENQIAQITAETGTRYKIDHFEIRQILPINASKIIPLTLQMHTKLFDIIGILGKHTNASHAKFLDFLNWHEKQQMFTFDEAISWLPQNEEWLDLIELGFVHEDLLIVEHPLYFTAKDDRNVISHNTSGLQEVLELKRNGKIAEFTLQGKDCFAIYGFSQLDKVPTVPIYCFLREEDKSLQLLLVGNITYSNVLQILALSSDTIAILLEDSVEIWCISCSELKLEQRISTNHAKHMSAIHQVNGIIYLAIILHSTQQNATIEIYSNKDTLQFRHLQTLYCIEPQQVEFATIAASQDLLLYVRSTNEAQSLLIYQYKGVLGFQNILSNSILPSAQHMQPITLKSVGRHFVALLHAEQITFVEVMLSFM